MLNVEGVHMDILMATLKIKHNRTVQTTTLV